jgi:hypothetical protein
MSIEIYPHTITEYLTWQKAQDLCQSLEVGWRLPTLEELDYLHQLGKEGTLTLGNYGCWGRRRDDDLAWSKGFHTGNIYLNPLTNLNFVLPVRDTTG